MSAVADEARSPANRARPLDSSASSIRLAPCRSTMRNTEHVCGAGDAFTTCTLGAITSISPGGSEPAVSAGAIVLELGRRAAAARLLSLNDSRRLAGGRTTVSCPPSSPTDPCVESCSEEAPRNADDAGSPSGLGGPLTIVNPPK